MKLTEVQLKTLRKVQEAWATQGTVYEDIMMNDDIVYMLLSNGTAYSINSDGKCNWVTTGWEKGKTIVERPSGRLMVETDEVIIRWLCHGCIDYKKGCNDVRQSNKPTECIEGKYTPIWTAARYTRDESGIEIRPDCGMRIDPLFMKWLRRHGTLRDMIMWKEELISREYYKCSLGIPCNRCETTDCELPEEVR